VQNGANDLVKCACNFGRNETAKVNQHYRVRRRFMSTRPSVMGPMMSSLPSERRAAELMLLSVVDALAATSCCQRERRAYLGTRGSSDDGHWACNGFTGSTVPATGLRAPGFGSARLRSQSSPQVLCCDRLRLNPSVSCTIDPDPMQDHCELARQSHFGALRASPLGDVHPPALEF
jgi:hypothetical protein